MADRIVLLGYQEALRRLHEGPPVQDDVDLDDDQAHALQPLPRADPGEDRFSPGIRRMSDVAEPTDGGILSHIAPTDNSVK